MAFRHIFKLMYLPWLLFVTTIAVLFFLDHLDDLTVLLILISYFFSLIVSAYINVSHGNKHTWPLIQALPYCLDLSFYTCILFMFGGASNGAVFVLFIPIVIAALKERPYVSWFIAVTAIVIYSVMMLNGHAGHFEHLSADFIQHLAGMWLTFVVSSLLLTGFITNLQLEVKNQAKKIAAFKERQLRDEQILAVATTSANAAHSMATPLSTASLLVDELRMGLLSESNQQILFELEQQICRCSDAVHSIAEQARQSKEQMVEYVIFTEFVEQVINHWWVSCNEIQYEIQVDLGVNPNQYIIESDMNLKLSIINILENSAFASLSRQSNKIDIYLTIENKFAVIKVDDFGHGISAELLQKLGFQPVSDKELGMGMGLLLANTTIERFEGSLTLQNTGEGTLSTIKLPYVPQPINEISGKV